jgi:hypothetical protein
MLWSGGKQITVSSASCLMCHVTHLQIHITTVALESTFSTGGRVIDPYWASLSTVQIMLVCGAHWVWKLHGLK